MREDPRAPAIAAALGIAKTLGAKRAIELPVSVAAHSPLMAEAADGMAKVLAGITFRDPHPALLANADAAPITTAAACRAAALGVKGLTAGAGRDRIRVFDAKSTAHQ